MRITNRIGVCLALFLLLAAAPALHAQNLDMGDSYRELDARASRVTTEFREGLAIADRLSDGRIESRLFIRDEVVASLSADSTGAIELRTPWLGEGAVNIERLAYGPVTADWTNAQLYCLWNDLLALDRRFDSEGESLQWFGGLVRPMGVLGDEKRSPDEFKRSIDEQIIAVRHEFADFVVESRADRQPVDLDGKGNVFFPTFTTLMTERYSGKQIGIARYYAAAKAFAWNIEGYTDGYATNQTIPEGWHFSPNMAWANIQLFGFRQYHVLAIFEDEPGCCGLHWLDDSIFRPCCDQHDKCYEKYGCTAKSWFFLGGWSCAKCNIAVVFCFATFGGGGGGAGGGGGGGGGGGCVQSGGAWCPAECFSCTQAY